MSTAPPESPGTALVLEQFPEKLAVVRLPAGAEVPAWAESSSLFSITATATETSLICAGRDVPTKVVAVRGLTAFAVEGAVEGPLATGSAGTLVGLLAPLADDGITVHALTTHETVWVLVPVSDAERSAEAWRRAGHVVHAATPVEPTRKRKQS